MKINIKLDNLNEILLILTDKYNINFVTENNIKKRFNNLNFDLKTIINIDKYFMNNKLYKNIYFVKNHLKIINLIDIFNKKQLNNLYLSLINDDFLSYFYKDLINKLNKYLN